MNAENDNEGVAAAAVRVNRFPPLLAAAAARGENDIDNEDDDDSVMAGEERDEAVAAAALVGVHNNQQQQQQQQEPQLRFPVNPPQNPRMQLQIQNQQYYQNQHYQQQYPYQNQSQHQQYHQNQNTNRQIIPRSTSDRQCLTWQRIPPGGGGGGNGGGFAAAIAGATGVVGTNNIVSVPPPRSGAASVVVKGKLYVFGGYGGGTGRLDDFYSYSFETGNWEEVLVKSLEKPGCRENNGVVISDASRSIYLFGGYNGSRWLNDLWKFDIETARWTCIQESSDSTSNSAAANGASNNNNNNESGVGGNGVIVDNTVSDVKGNIPSRRFGYVSVVHEGKFVLFGGFDGTRWLNDMYEFNFSTKTWTEIAARGALPSVRSCPAWAKDDTHVYIQGGYDGVERKSDFFACDLATYTWTEMPSLGTPPSPRYFHSCCIYGHKMYLYGGYSGSERLADMYAYDFETNHWSQVDCTSGDAPSGRSSLVAQVYENCLYVFGGYNGTNVLNDFYRFRLKPISVPPPALVHDFCKLINDPDLADVHFLVEGHVVYAHRAVLAIRSKFFNAMLCGGMRESSSGGVVAEEKPYSIAKKRSSSGDADYSNKSSSAGGSSSLVLNGSDSIPLPGVSYSVFLKVMEYLYTDTVKDVSLETGIQLLIASEQFLLDRLKALCEDYIRRDIHVDTVIHILVAAHRHNASGLKDIALEFILRNLNDPTVMAGLSELKAEPELLLEIIKRNNGGGGSGTFNAAGRSYNAAGGGGGGGPQQDYPSGPFGVGAEWDARR